VLEQCRDFEDIEKLLPYLSPSDVAAKTALNFLELSSSSSSPHVKDAFILSLALWAADKNAPSSTDYDPLRVYVNNIVKVYSNKDLEKPKPSHIW